MDARAIFRAGNEHIAAMARRAPGAQASFICECDDEGCLAPMELTADEYDELLAPDGCYLVLQGHEGASTPVRQWRHYATVGPEGEGDQKHDPTDQPAKPSSG